jgi:ribokinase
MPNKIVVIGSSNVDMVMTMKRLPRLGETITDAAYIQTFGGKGANQAVAAARAGGEVVFVNCVGDDAFTPLMLENFRKDGINIDYVFRESGIHSGTALVMIGEKGENYLSVDPGANYRLTPAYIDKARAVIQEAAFILLQYEIPVATLQYVIDLAAQYSKKVIWNFAPAREFNLAYLEKVHILVLNENEAELLCGLKVGEDWEYQDITETILSAGPQIVIMTLGANGCYLAYANIREYIPAFHVQAVDTTGAGDVYCACLAVALTEGRDLAAAIKFASAAAAISVTRIGAQPSAPTRAEIEAFLRSHAA